MACADTMACADKMIGADKITGADQNKPDNKLGAPKTNLGAPFSSVSRSGVAGRRSMVRHAAHLRYFFFLAPFFLACFLVDAFFLEPAFFFLATIRPPNSVFGVCRVSAPSWGRPSRRGNAARPNQIVWLLDYRTTARKN
jgi:hypothetical protein